MPPLRRMRRAPCRRASSSPCAGAGVGRTAAPAASIAPDLRKRRREVFVGPLRMAVTPVRPHHLTGNVRKPTLRRPRFLSGAGAAGLPFLHLAEARGAERRKASNQFAPCGRAHPLRSGCPPSGAPPRFSGAALAASSASGRAFVRTCPDRQRAPRGRLVVACRAEPRSRPGAW